MIGPPGGDRDRSARRRRAGWFRSNRSSSTDRPMAIPQTRAASQDTNRRLSVDVGIGWGVTPARLDRASFSYNYR